jgi:hypothetical protein
VTIVNTAPTATVSLSDAGPGTDDTLIATASGATTTAIGVLLTYVWKVDVGHAHDRSNVGPSLERSRSTCRSPATVTTARRSR